MMVPKVLIQIHRFDFLLVPFTFIPRHMFSFIYFHFDDSLGIKIYVRLKRVNLLDALHKNFNGNPLSLLFLHH